MYPKEYNDISLTLSQFVLRLTGAWITANNSEERQRILVVSYTVLINMYGLYLNLGDAYCSQGDFNRCIFLICNTLCILLGLFKILVVNNRRTTFKYLISFARQNFWHFKYDREEKVLFMKCRQFCKLWTVIACSVTQMSLTFYIITPLVANINRNMTDRVLPFKMWIDLPVTETPYYEIIFVTQLLAVQQAGAVYMCNDTFMCVLNMHVICQFRILQHRLLNMWSIINKKQMNSIDYADSYYTALKKCIQQHQSLIEFCDNLEYVYTLPIFGHVIVVSLLLCLDIYEIVLADVPISTRLIFVFHMIGSLVHILFFTYSCHGLIEESENISMATYSGWWMVLPMTETGKMLRRDIKMMMMKSMRPCYLSAGGFFPVSLETCTALISSTVSYFTLIKGSSGKITEE
ncbi:PREDICTED: odorant receptor 30a-like [Eufriesea mexicana]|uniref:odorant receptor 30a-like n=1 Tax=Eufriesea mexicana TaxID=516756 RepID=UPI00083BE71A|nr:PREDICTED: odorant receptor 30a-like [Eufriesea mexicana]